MKMIPININASRVLDAISKIGYTANTAIMDIIDNSVTALSTDIKIYIERIKGTTLADKNNAKSYMIVDNGKGMSSEEIVTALELGSIQEYDENSLSKYGMGLKSAGLSLGTRIQVISKQNNIYSTSYILDKNEVKSDLVIIEKEISDEDIKKYDKFLTDSNGSIIQVTGCEEVNNRSIQTTIKHLEKKLGVVYYEFLKNNADFNITILEGDRTIEISSSDILFMDDTITFEKESYECNFPCKIFDQELPLPILVDGEQKTSNAKLEIVIFPQGRMSGYAGFDTSTKNRIKNYDVTEKNSGFFIYRNNRLIRWGDNLDGVVPFKTWGFRAKLKIDSSLDDTLHVDVSKQRLLIPDEILEQIKSKIRPALQLHETIMSMCSELVNNGKEGDSSNEVLEDFAANDPDIDPRFKVTEDKLKRQEKLKEKSEELNVKNQIDEESKFTENNVFKRVRYSYRVAHDLFWESGWDPDYGDYIIINQNHTFYHDVLCNLKENSDEKIAIESLLYCCAASENLTFQDLNTDDKIIEEVFIKFKRLLSHNLGKVINTARDKKVD